MNMGFTLDEKIFGKITPFDLLCKAKEMGISSIEMSPDKKILPLKYFLKISQSAHSLGININFHIPYFADGFLYEIMNFNDYRRDIIKKYESFMSIVENIQSITNKASIITIHGAKYGTKENKTRGINSTLTFLDWLLNFMVQKNICAKIALETIDNQEIGIIGNNREDIFYILNKFRSSRLGICWDICHDAKNYYPHPPELTNYFFENIIHCHIHGIQKEKSISHIPVKQSDIDFSKQINFLMERDFRGTLNLELLVDFCGENYLSDLLNDIDYIRNLI